jgi:hypothetical protein
MMGEKKMPWPKGGMEGTAVETHLDTLVRNHEAFLELEPEIEARYGRKEYVAFRGGVQVDHDPDKVALRGRNPGKGVFIGSLDDQGLGLKEYKGERPRNLM